MDFLIPFNFVQQAPPVAAAQAIPGNPNLGPQPFAHLPFDRTVRAGAAGHTRSTSGGACETLPTESQRSVSVGGSVAAGQTAAGGGGGDLGGAAAFEQQQQQADGFGDLDDYLGTMDLDAFDFDWGDYGALFPGAEAFLPDPPAVPPLGAPFVGDGFGVGPQEEDEAKDS